MTWRFSDTVKDVLSFDFLLGHSVFLFLSFFLDFFFLPPSATVARIAQFIVVYIYHGAINRLGHVASDDQDGSPKLLWLAFDNSKDTHCKKPFLRK